MTATRDDIIKEMQQLYSNPCTQFIPAIQEQVDERYTYLLKKLKAIDAENDKGLGEWKDSGDVADTDLNYHVTDDEMALLQTKYGLRFRTASEFGAFDARTKKWILLMMNVAYEKGNSDKGRV